MSTATALVPAGETSLETFADQARREHQFCMDAAAAALTHAINCGEALLRARELVEDGGWERWVNHNFPKPTMTRAYMRLAYYRDHLTEFDGNNGMRGALDYLRGLPSFAQNQRAHGPETIEEARRLLQLGLSQRDVAELLGVSRRCVGTWARGEFHSGGRGRPTSAVRRERSALKRRARREREARRALRREESAKAAKRAPDVIGEAYSMVRKTAQVVARGAEEAEFKKEVRDALSVALLRLHAAEEAVVQAVGLS